MTSIIEFLHRIQLDRQNDKKLYYKIGEKIT